MKGARRGRGGIPQRSVIVVAGEHTNDRTVVARLIRELCPGLPSEIAEIRDDVRLKQATGANLTARVRTLVRKANAKATSRQAELAGLVVHEDLDGVTDGRYATVRRTLAEALSSSSPCPTALALAAWETEAWLLLFPDAFPRVHPGWRLPAALTGRDTGMIASPKEALQRRLGTPRFREDDGVRVISAACELGLVAEAGRIRGGNRSYRDFVAELDQWSGPGAPPAP